MTAAQDRYAIYFSPDRESPLGIFGRQWLGYDADTGETVEQTRLATLSRQRLAEITAEPRRYGFHATLKPPFALAEGRGVDELSAAMEAFAAQRHSVLAAPLTLASLSGFWALVPSRPCGTVDLLAEDCVRRFDAFRAPPSIDELARRRRAGLSEAEDALLVRWGYPYVMEAFRFHLTLTQRLDPAEGARLAGELSSMVAPLCREAVHVDAIALFRQPARQGYFRLVRRYRLVTAISSSGSDG
jgi:putative phosphonate metabolism protein